MRSVLSKLIKTNYEYLLLDVLTVFIFIPITGLHGACFTNATLYQSDISAGP